MLHGHVLRRENGHVLKRALDFEVESQSKKWRPKRTWKKQVEEKKCQGWLDQGQCTLPIKVGCWSPGGIQPDLKHWSLSVCHASIIFQLIAPLPIISVVSLYIHFIGTMSVQNIAYQTNT